MHYDIFGNSKYLQPGSKLPINSFQELFQHKDALKKHTIKKLAYLDKLENKLLFLDLTTTDFIKKFNAFALNSDLLANPAKYTSFLDTIVHFQFALILVGMEYAKWTGKIETNKKNIKKMMGKQGELNEQKIDNFILYGTIADQPFLEYYYRGLTQTIIAKNPAESFSFSSTDAIALRASYEQSQTPSKMKMLEELVILQELKNNPLYKTQYEVLKVAAEEQLKKEQATFLNPDAWKASPKKNQKTIAESQKIILKSNDKIKRIISSLEQTKIKNPAISQTAIPSLIEARKVFDSLSCIKNEKCFSREALFGKPKKMSVGNTLSHPGFIDFMFQIFNDSCTHSTARSKPDPFVTLHEEQLFLRKIIEDSLLTLQNSSQPRNKFPIAYPRILFAYILNLMLFTILTKATQRSSLLGLKIKIWNSALRLICHDIPNFFDVNTHEDTQTLVSYFTMYWADDYFYNDDASKKIAARPSSAHPIPAEIMIESDDDWSDDDWSDDGSSSIDAGD